MDENVLTVLTMCSDLAKPKGYPEPLSPKRFFEIKRQVEKRISLSAMLFADVFELICCGLMEREISRIIALRREGVDEAAFSLSREHGITICTAVEDGYPKALLSVSNVPPILYLRGDSGLLKADRVRVAVVGSREPDDCEGQFAEDFAQKAANSGYIVISGAAKGIDRAATSGALSAGGAVISVFPHGLLDRRTQLLDSRMHGKYLSISACSARERFSSRRALERNEYIYALAEASVVVGARANAGGTWHGASNALVAGRKIYALNRGQGNAALISMGARDAECFWPEIRDQIRFIEN